MAFQCSEAFIEPSPLNRVRNLLTKYDWRLALPNKPREGREQVSGVFVSFRSPVGDVSNAKRLARARSAPDWFGVRPSSKPEGAGPPANSGEEMTLRVSAKIFRSDIFYAPFIHITRRYQAGCYKVPQPLRRVWVALVVIGAHRCPLKWRAMWTASAFNCCSSPSLMRTSSHSQAGRASRPTSLMWCWPSAISKPGRSTRTL